MLGALTQTIETAPSDVGDDNVPDEFPDQVFFPFWFEISRLKSCSIHSFSL